MKNELKMLKKYYPYQVIEPDNRFFGRAFLSKIPIFSHNIKYYYRSNRHYLVIMMKTPQGKNIGSDHFPVITKIALRNPEILK